MIASPVLWWTRVASVRDPFPKNLDVASNLFYCRPALESNDFRSEAVSPDAPKYPYPSRELRKNGIQQQIFKNVRFCFPALESNKFRSERVPPEAPKYPDPGRDFIKKRNTTQNVQKCVFLPPCPRIQRLLVQKVAPRGT